MANTSIKHKQKKSQKRKDRQLRRQQKRLEKNKAQVDVQPIETNTQENADAQKQQVMKKSLPGFLAKNTDLICRWLKDYCILFCKADDAQIDFFKNMTREKRNQYIQDYVDIFGFIKMVDELKAKNNSTSQ